MKKELTKQEEIGDYGHKCEYCDYMMVPIFRLNGNVIGYKCENCLSTKNK